LRLYAGRSTNASQRERRDALVRVLHARGWTESRLAEEIKLNQSTVSRILKPRKWRL